MVEQLEQFIDSAKTNQETSQAMDRLKLFNQNQAKIDRFFNTYLAEGFVRFKRGELDTTTGEEKFQGDMLSLVDNNDLEETIAISSITNRSENYFAEQLWCLNHRFAVLNHGKKVTDRGNPAGPIQYCEALRKALQRVGMDTNTKIIAYKVFDQSVIMAGLTEIFDQLNDYLKDQGFFPDLRYRPEVSDSPAPPVPQVEEVPLEHVEAGEPAAAQEQTTTATGQPRGNLAGVMPGPGSAGSPASAGYMPAPDATQPSEQYQGDLMGAIRVLQEHMTSGPAGAAVSGQVGAAGQEGVAGGAAGPAEGAGGAPVNAAGDVASAAAPGGRQGMVYTSQQLVGALQSLQTQALAVAGETIEQAEPGTLAPQQVALVSSQLRAQLQDDMGGEELAMESMDMHTIDLVGMLFEYMLSDDNLPSSIKALLSYLHTPFLKVAFLDKDFFEQVNHPARLLLNSMAEAAVKWVGNDGSDQYDLYNKIKSVVSKVLDEFQNDVRIFAELLLEFSSYTKKIARRQELVEKRAMEKVQGEEKLKEVKLRVNEAVKSRIDNRELPSAVLLLLLQPWSDYLAFILLRYGEESDSWQRAIKVVDDILWSIEPKDNNKDRTRQMEIHDALNRELGVGFETIGYDQAKSKKLLDALFSLQKMALQSKKAEPAPEPMRNKLESMAAEKAGKPKVEEDAATPEELRMVENLKMIEFGTWFEFEGGKRLKVAWYNSKTLHYMLVDQMGKKVAMKSGLELARAMLSHEARVIAGSSKPFFERALENIFQSLNSKAKAEQSEGVAND
ncbi:MAG: hypothetical protein AseanaTS_09150 [Candidatus Pelagadaptatus aseana]|uniref:DUF1631 family protein n=1 Tax=Candidatus Pelagadaptatus aseana TaxID=3120508 RepID=UPI0039B16974